MDWRSDASYKDEDETPPAMPWRAGAAIGPATEASPVVVEAWDDEIHQPTRSDELAAAARRGRARIGPATRHAFNLIVFAAAVLGALAGAAVAWMHVMNDPLADAHAYFDAAARLNAGAPLYPVDADPNGNQIYLYPPLLAIVLRPLALLGFPLFAAVWEAIVILAFVLLLRKLGVERRATWLAVGLLGIPIGWALSVAQAHVPLTLLLAIGQPWSIALAANLKLTPVLIALWWLGRRDFESFFAFLVWMALLALAQLGLEAQGTFAFFSNVGVDQLGAVRNLSPFPQSPQLWLALVLVGGLVTLALARTRWGWPAAVTLVTLSPPRLLVYMLMGLIAGIREPNRARAVDPDDRRDAVAALGRASR
jgi:hypothetical protein